MMSKLILLLGLITCTTLASASSNPFVEFLLPELVVKPVQNFENFVNQPISSLYTIKDRRILADKREKHLQLTINLYRREEYSLMLKSMKLFDKYYRNKPEQALLLLMQISALDNKIKDKKEISAQIVSMAKRAIGIKSYNYNLQLALERIILREYARNHKWAIFNKTLATYKEKVNKLDSLAQKRWVDRIEFESSVVENSLSKSSIDQVYKSSLSEVERSDYYLYYLLLHQDITQLKKLTHLSWDNYSLSLLNNLFVAHAYMNKNTEAQKAFSLLCKYYKKDCHNKKSNILLYIMGEGADRHYTHNKFSTVNKIVKLRRSVASKKKLSILFTDEESALLTNKFQVMVWNGRLNNFSLHGQDSEFLEYLRFIPFKNASSDEQLEILGGVEDYWGALYKGLLVNQQYQPLITHWEGTARGMDDVRAFGDKVLSMVSKAYLMTDSVKSFYGVARYIEDDNLVYELELFKDYLDKNWKGVIAKTHSREEYSGIRSLALFKQGKLGESELTFEKTLGTNLPLKVVFKNDFLYHYLKLVKRKQTPGQFYRTLQLIESARKVGGVKENRIKEYIDLEIIGLNMTLKNSSYEEILQKVNIFLKSYPQTQFYSIVKLTRAKVLARLKKIVESQDALYDVVKETEDSNIRSEALSELAALKETESL